MASESLSTVVKLEIVESSISTDVNASNTCAKTSLSTKLAENENKLSVERPKNNAEILELLNSASGAFGCNNPYKGKKLHKCDDCGKRYWNRDEHMLTHLTDRPFKCIVCPKMFKTKAYLNAHQRNHRNKLTKQFQCDQCSAFFSSNGQLKRHKDVHSDVRPFKCDQCDRTFRVQKYLKFHEMSHSNPNKKPKGSPLTKCNICGRGCHNITTHMMEHSGERLFQCELCQNTFKTKHHLTNHMAIHINARAYKCKLCARSFNYRNQLKRHSQAHSSQLSFVCDICGHAFKYNNSLRLHMRTHSGEKPFKCDLCEKCFSTSVSLRLHYRVHTGEKPYKCELCGRGFADGSTMKIHKRTHTGEHPYICHLCGKSTKQASNLKSHYRHFHKIFDMTSKTIRSNARIFERYKSELLASKDLLDILSRGAAAADDVGKASNSEIYFNTDADAMQHAMDNVPAVATVRKVKIKSEGNKKRSSRKVKTEVEHKIEDEFPVDDLSDHFSSHSNLNSIESENDAKSETETYPDQPEIKPEIGAEDTNNVSTLKSEMNGDTVRFTLSDYSKYLADVYKPKDLKSDVDFSYFSSATGEDNSDSISKPKISKKLLKLLIAKQTKDFNKTGAESPKLPKLRSRRRSKIAPPPKIEEILINEKTDEIIMGGQIKSEKLDQRCDEWKSENGEDFSWFNAPDNVVNYTLDNFPKKSIKIEGTQTRPTTVESDLEAKENLEHPIWPELKRNVVETGNEMYPVINEDNQDEKLKIIEENNMEEDEIENDLSDHFDSPIETQAISDIAKKPIFTTKGVKFNKCTICNRRYMNHDEHMRTHTHERPFECDVCQKTFKTKDYLKLHKRLHSNEKNAICDQCGATFRQTYDLHRHMKRHSDERPHCCATCGKAFKEKCALQTHLRTHSGEKPYKCSECDKYFSTRMGMKLHLRTHTGEKPFKCDYCDSRFCDGSTYRQHVRTHTGERPYRCHICGKGTTQAGNLKSHLRHYHKIIVKHVNMSNTKYL